MNRKLLRDFWILLALVYGIVGIAVLRAEETGVQRASALINEGKADQAIVILQGELQKNPQAADTQVVLGMAYLQKSDFSQAAAAFERAAAIKPDLVPAHYHLAMLYEREGKRSQALAEWKKVEQYASAQQDLRELAKKHIRQLEGNQ